MAIAHSPDNSSSSSSSHSHSQNHSHSHSNYNSTNQPALPMPPSNLHSSSSSSAALSLFSSVSSYFCFSSRSTTYLTEIRSGFIVFLSVSYTLFLNSQLLAPADPLTGARHSDRLSIALSTAISSGLMTILFGLTTNFPLAFAPGIGLTAYFASLSQNSLALNSSFLTGILIILFAALRGASLLRRFLPSAVQVGLIVGLGFFLAFIGFQSIGLMSINDNGGSVLQLGNLHSIDLWVGFAGLLLLSALTMHSVPGAALISVATIAAIEFVIHSNWPSASEIIEFPSLRVHSPLVWADFNLFDSIPIMISLFLVAVLDATGVLISFNRLMRISDESIKPPSETVSLFLVGVGVLFSSLLGIPPLILSIESCIGIREGGRTGFSSIVTGVCFLLSIPFLGLFQSFPPIANAGVLIFLGSLMIAESQNVRWNSILHALPALVTMLVIPFTSSIANGVLFGLIAHFVLLLTSGSAAQFFVSGDGYERIAEQFNEDEDNNDASTQGRNSNQNLNAATTAAGGIGKAREEKEFQQTEIKVNQ